MVTLDELREQAIEANREYQAAEQADRDAYAARFDNIDDAVGQITTLLDAAPYVPGGDVAPTIRSVADHNAATLAKHSGVALDLILDGMEILAAATLDALIIISRELKNRDR